MGVEGKRLLVLGAGRGQIGLYKAAKEMGITTIAGTMPDNNPPGIPLADEVCFMNIADPDEVAKKAAKLKLDGVCNMLISFVDLITDAGFGKYIVQHDFENDKDKENYRKIESDELLDMLENRNTMERTFRLGKRIYKTFIEENSNILGVEEYDSQTFSGSMLPDVGEYYEIHSEYIQKYIEKLRGCKINQR